ncbi:hypothetical protein BJY16_008539 [Actinoplanes octamycinicus]|uniref:Uncharacterized protein n=1 Tax=Actinoplanes octamycinicus TaxID=135948 RepID=A0A7W7MCR5_9ACTN|nr:hypothetical protein [Actinoplanes octamycinicus]MBB4745080.1 hypothetical protein [Actinoplanes octamycinicus]GIE55666.1 hypothetical protein Aoc01nite_10680 [Actinoplanes octamycinicus]
MRRELTGGGLLSPLHFPLLFLLLWGVLSLPYGPLLALPGAAVLTVLLAAGVSRMAGSAWFRGLDRRPARRTLALCLTVLPAAVTTMLTALLGLSLIWAVPLGLVLLTGATAIHLTTPRPRHPRSWPAPPPQPPPASLAPPPFVPAPGRPGTPPPPPDRLAHAREVLTASGPGAALPVLQMAISDPAVDPVPALAVADELVEAESRRAEQTHDDRPYAAAIAVLTDLVQRHPDVPGGRSLVHSHRAQFLMFQAGRLTETTAADDPALAGKLQELFGRTETELRAAIGAAPPGSADWARESAALGLLYCHAGDRIDEGISLIRRGLDERLPREQRAQAGLDLAEALGVRIRREARPGDRDEVDHLLRQVARAGPPYDERAAALRAAL